MYEFFDEKILTTGGNMAVAPKHLFFVVSMIAPEWLIWNRETKKSLLVCFYIVVPNYI